MKTNSSKQVKSIDNEIKVCNALIKSALKSIKISEEDILQEMQLIFICESELSRLVQQKYELTK